MIDVGSGPGTASFAFFAGQLLNQYRRVKKFPFKDGVSSGIWPQQNYFRSGDILLQHYLSYFDDWNGDIELKTETRDWWRRGKDFNHEASLVLFGNVLNESPADPQNYQKGLLPFLENPKGGGVLFIEPAFKIWRRGPGITDSGRISFHPEKEKQKFGDHVFIKKNVRLLKEETGAIFLFPQNFQVNGSNNFQSN